MAKGKINLKEQLMYDRFEFNLLQKIPCSKEENKKYAQILKDGEALPKGVFEYSYGDGTTSTTEFYTIYKTDLNQEEIDEYLKFKQLKFIKTIKNCVVFFTVLTVLSIIAGFIIAASV